MNYGQALQLVTRLYIKHTQSSENQLCAATAYYDYEAYLLKVGLILYCGTVCSYITWNGINKTEREKFSHTEEDYKFMTYEASTCNANRCNKYSSNTRDSSLAAYAKAVSGDLWF